LHIGLTHLRRAQDFPDLGKRPDLPRSGLDPAIPSRDRSGLPVVARVTDWRRQLHNPISGRPD
jgi:hypothetical protein